MLQRDICCNSAIAAVVLVLAGSNIDDVTMATDLFRAVLLDGLAEEQEINYDPFLY